LPLLFPSPDREPRAVEALLAEGTVMLFLDTVWWTVSMNAFSSL
jgi:hypothetical protein